MRFRLLIYFLAVFFLATFPYSFAQTGKCVPLYQVTPQRTPLNSYRHPICNRYLEAAGVTHIWIDQSLANQHLTDSTDEKCLSAVSFVHDVGPSALANSFTVNQPSETCQRSLLMALCLTAYKPCEPNMDSLHYQTSDRQKPCKWLCELYHNTADQSICTAEDRAFLERAGYDLTQVPYFDCNNTDIWRDIPYDDTTDPPLCIGTTNIPYHSPAPRCEEYSPNSNGFCSGVFGQSTVVFIPSDTSQEEMETFIKQYASMWFTVPYNLDDGDCQGAQLRAYCTAVFQECVDAGVKLAELQEKNNFLQYGVLQKSSRPLPLPPPTSTCEIYQQECRNTKYYSWAIESASDLETVFFPNCTIAAAYRQVKCLDRTKEANVKLFGLNSELFGSKQYISTFASEMIAYNAITPMGTILSPNVTTNAVFHLGRNFAGSSNDYISTIPFQSACPSPLIIPTNLAYDLSTTQHTVFGGLCSVACPPINLIYSKKNLSKLETIIEGVVTFQFIVMSILLLTLFVFNSMRAKPLLLFYVLSYWFVIAVIFLSLRLRGSQSIHQFACENEVDLYHMKGFGLFQAIVLIYFLLASSAWWLCQVSDLYMRLILGRTYRRGSRQKLYRDLAFHLFSWGTPALSIIPLVLSEQLGYDQYLPYAWATIPPNVTSNPIQLSTFFFFIPIMILAVIGFAMVSIILYFLIQYDPNPQATEQRKEREREIELSRNNPSPQSEQQQDPGRVHKVYEQFSSSKSFWFKFLQSVKLFGFVVMMIAFIILLFVHEINSSQHRSKWEASIQRFAMCILEKENMGSGEFCHQSIQGEMMGQSDILLHLFGIMIPGIIAFVLHFILSQEAIMLWFGLVAYGLGCSLFKPCARHDTQTGGFSTDASAGASSTDSKDKSTHSTDLFGEGGHVLKKQKKGDHSDTNTITSDTVDEGSIGGNTVCKGVGGGAIPTSAAGSKDIRNADHIIDLSSKEATKRRKTMFIRNPSAHVRLPRASPTLAPAIELSTSHNPDRESEISTGHGSGTRHSIFHMEAQDDPTGSFRRESDDANNQNILSFNFGRLDLNSPPILEGLESHDVLTKGSPVFDTLEEVDETGFEYDTCHPPLIEEEEDDDENRF